MASSKLSPAEIESALRALPAWKVVDNKLHRDFRFPDFPHAFGFMAASAVSIEKLDHHPAWTNVYNRVAVDLTTHDAGGITAKDIELAALLEAMAERLA